MFSRTISKVLLASLIGVTSAAAVAEPGPLPFRPGVAQADAEGPATVAAHRTDDPLVREKYRKSPDLMRFLRGTYGESCVRGLVNESAKTIKANLDGQFSEDMRRAAAQVLEAGRIWRLNSLEMEALFKGGYVHATYYCECLIKEVTDEDLLDPAKGVEVLDAIPKSTQATCEMLAGEQAQRYHDRYVKKK